MKVDIYVFELISEKPYEHNITPTPFGYLNLDCEHFREDEAQKCWDICNWDAYASEKPENLFSTIGCCSHGICFKPDDGTQANWLALSCGWLCGTSTEIADYVRINKYNTIWFNSEAHDAMIRADALEESLNLFTKRLWARL